MAGKKNGSEAVLFKSARGTIVDTAVALAPNAWYKVASIAATASALPDGIKVTGVFRTPDTGETPITLVVGDSVYPITLTRICKTDCDYNFEEGTTEVTDDCSEGYVEMINDGFVTISGTFNGFDKFDPVTDAIVEVNKELFGRFMDVIEDVGTGVYTVTPKSNESLELFLCKNKSADVDQIQNWVILEVNITGLASGSGLKDSQKRDVTWTKAEGVATFYQRTVFADDKI